MVPDAHWLATANHEDVRRCFAWDRLRVNIPWRFHADAPARVTRIESTSNLNGPAFLSPSRKPTALTSVGFTGPASFTRFPNEVASNLSRGTLISIHSSFFVWTIARYAEGNQRFFDVQVQGVLPAIAPNLGDERVAFFEVELLRLRPHGSKTTVVFAATACRRTPGFSQR